MLRSAQCSSCCGMVRFMWQASIRRMFTVPTVKSKSVLGLSRIRYFGQPCAFSGERTCYVSSLWGTFVKFWNATFSLMSVCPSACNSAAHIWARIFMTFDVWVLFENLSRKFKSHYSVVRMTGTLPEQLCTFMITPHRISLRISNTGDESCWENHNTHIMSNNYFPKIVSYMRYCGKIRYSQTARK